MRNVFIVGPTCSGKTSLLNFLKQHAARAYHFPIRVISRPPRVAEDRSENTFLGKEEFIKKRETSEFFISWQRLLENDRKEYYGFFAKDVSDEEINIFSANNALLLYPDSIIPADILKKHRSYFIFCAAPEQVRLRRLKERSPEYGSGEVDVRIYRESVENYLDRAAMVVDNDKATLEENGRKVLAFLETL